MNQTSGNDLASTELRDRIKQAQHKIIDVAEAILDTLTRQHVSVPAAVAVQRRLIANIVGAWQFCDRSQCRRSRCCRGEPLDCLRVCIPLLPPEALAVLTQHGKGAARPRTVKARR